MPKNLKFNREKSMAKRSSSMTRLMSGFPKTNSRRDKPRGKRLRTPQRRLPIRKQLSQRMRRRRLKMTMNLTHLNTLKLEESSCRI